MMNHFYPDGDGLSRMTVLQSQEHKGSLAGSDKYTGLKTKFSTGSTDSTSFLRWSHLHINDMGKKLIFWSFL